MPKGEIMMEHVGNPKYVQIRDDIMKKIAEGVWEENQQIPSEVMMMKEYEVGRETLRKAIKMLIDGGYLYIRKGVGTFVSKLKVGLSLEPFVSLTYFLHSKGIEIDTQILEYETVVISKKLAEKTGLKQGSEALFIKRYRTIGKKPVCIENYHFSLRQSEIVKDFDFTKSIYHYLFEELKLKVTNMNISLKVLPPNGPEAELLKIQQGSKMIILNRTVNINEEEEPFFHLEFYCEEED